MIGVEILQKLLDEAHITDINKTSELEYLSNIVHICKTIGIEEVSETPNISNSIMRVKTNIMKKTN